MPTPSRPSEDVVATYASLKAQCVPKVQGIRSGKSRGVRVAYDEDSGYTIDIYLTVAFGANIPETAWNVQKSVNDGLVDEYGIDAVEINIHVQGVYTG